MLCQKCQTNLATIRYAEVVDGHVTEQQLCPACVSVLEGGASSGFELADVQHSRRAPAPRVAGENERNQQACGVCGMPLTSIVAHHRVGCPSCYTNFEPQIAPLLLAEHRSGFHKGKTARALTTRDRLRTDLYSKKALLRSIVKAENYEEAARLRDEIRQLQSSLSAGDAETE